MSDSGEQRHGDSSKNHRRRNDQTLRDNLAQEDYATGGCQNGDRELHQRSAGFTSGGCIDEIPNRFAAPAADNFLHLFGRHFGAGWREKRKFGEIIRSKTPVAQRNELLLKVLCHNIVCVIHEIHESGVAATFPALCPTNANAFQQLTD